MEAQEQIERPKILIFDDGDEIVQSQAVLTKQLPFADVEAVRSLVDFRKAVDITDYDVVILEQTLRSISGVELLVEMKLKDTEPSVLVTSRSVDPYVLATVYNAGCHRCIVKEGRWLDELAPAVRHLLRIRRLEKENAKLIAKLTEANCYFPIKINVLMILAER